jgi:hypothetical protein
MPVTTLDDLLYYRYGFSLNLNESPRVSGSETEYIQTPLCFFQT